MIAIRGVIISINSMTRIKLASGAVMETLILDFEPRIGMLVNVAIDFRTNQIANVWKYGAFMLDEEVEKTNTCTFSYDDCMVRGEEDR